MKQSVSKGFLQVISGGFSGLQVFWAPETILYLINGGSILSAFSSILSFKVHFIPLFVILILFSFAAFMCAKLLTSFDLGIAEYIHRVIELNLGVLVFVLVALLIFAFSALLLNFYGIDGTLKPTLLLISKLFTAILILYHYFVSFWLRPYYARNLSKRRAIASFRAWYRNNKAAFYRFCALLTLMIFAAIRVYKLIISLVLSPVIDGISHYTGADIQFRLHSFFSLWDILYNVAVIVGAFLVSNILFFPIVHFFDYYAMKLYPRVFTQGSQDA